MEFAGKVAIVTGPAKGMGAAITRMLARDGADLVLVGRDVAAIEPVAAEVRGLGRRAEIVRCDVTQPAEVQAMVDATLQAFDDRIDILVNIAGGTGPLETTSWDTTPEQFDQIIALNLKGCQLTMRAVLPTMMRRRSGKIVNIGGTFGLRGQALRSAYSASKWGLRGLTKSVALEVGPYNINVNNVAPGMVDGPRFTKVCHERAQRLGKTPDDVRREWEGNYALRRITTDEDVANAVWFFASERSRNITGQDLAVDGGWAM
jgi:3-oxoacyl-[acyl-carrier protein] reductase